MAFYGYEWIVAGDYLFCLPVSRMMASFRSFTSGRSTAPIPGAVGSFAWPFSMTGSVSTIS